jgi:glycosyltransferase involved in cell wall biosynthesis
MNRALRLAVLTDFAEEGWPSMDLCADMLLAHLKREGPAAVQASRLCPSFRRLATRLPVLGRRNAAFNADRILNRFLHFPRHARRAASSFDLFHVADHTYAQLIHALPPGRAGVYCHDLDAFRCLIDPTGDPRPRSFRTLTRRVLAGLQKAAAVFHSTAAVGDQIRRAGLVPADRLVLAPYGTAPEFGPGPTRDPVGLQWLEGLDGHSWLLHVGSCIPRKRIDVLLDVVAAVRETIPDARLVKIGGEWSTGQQDRIARLGLHGSIVHARDLTRAELAEVYRRAAVVLVPSEAEGFGLPVIEALACGSAVVASDIPALREAGGPAVTYAPVGDVSSWSELVTRMLTDPAAAPARADRLAWAGRYSWAAHAEIIASTYHRLLGAKPCAVSPD